MLIPMLTERFHLRYHHEMREQSTYALTVASGGPRLTRGDPDPPPGWKPAKDLPIEKERYWIMAGPGHIEANSIPIHILAEQLTRMNMLGRLVVDKTGLTGNYDFILDYVPARDNLQSGGLSGPSIFDALKERLGMKLEPGRGPVEIFHIDHVERPSEN